MLTIEQLRAMPEEERAGYLASLDKGLGIDERITVHCQSDAEEYERLARECRARLEHVRTRVRDARAYFATLEAAGLWPLSGAGG